MLNGGIKEIKLEHNCYKCVLCIEINIGMLFVIVWCAGFVSGAVNSSLSRWCVPTVFR